jgi:sarcosine oxidase subunit beta
MRGSLGFCEELAGHVLELMPSIAKLRVLRQWAGLCDITPDFSPIIGVTPVKGFLVDVGWGTYGFKAGPVAGEAMAELIATGRPPALIAPFALDRVRRDHVLADQGSTGTR